jgi:ketosteroid isomerase-like protein
MSLSLPARPHLDLLKRQAKTALRVGRVLRPEWRLADAQRALARGYGLASWTHLKQAIGSARQVSDAASEDPRLGRTGAGSVLRAVATPPSGFEGSWIARETSTDCVALEITDIGGGLLITQVVAPMAGDAVASFLLLRTDGHEHQLPLGDDLRVRAIWTEPQTLHTTVRRGDITVAEGTYTVSGEGQTLCFTAETKRLVFERASSPAVSMRGNRRLGGRVARAKSLTACAVVIAAALLGACAGKRGQTPAAPLRSGADLQAIEALNRHDIAAALASDVDAVVSQWTDDFVLIPPAGPVVRGRAANAAMIEQARPQLDKFEPVAYEVDFDEIIVTGDYAFAWGQFKSAARPRIGGSDIVSTGKLFRVYQRQPDGRWLMHRTMSVVDPTRR